ncbi:MAG: glycosyltransferase family 2 protein [Candidatus Omnitrophota bacterium]
MISVIIVTYNRKNLLEGCLNSIFAQESENNLEIIIVDNYSSDQTADFISKRYANSVKFIRNNYRMDIWSCKNMAVNRAEGDICAFTDDDCRVSENWLNEIKNSLNSYDFVGGVTYPSSGIKFPAWWKSSLGWLVGINTAPNKSYLPLGNNLAFHKYVLTEIDKATRNINVFTHLPYGEDNFRIKTAIACKFRMEINKNLVVYHHFNSKRLSLAYLIKRSLDEGSVAPYYQNNASSLFCAIVSAGLSFYKLIILFDINGFFRILTNINFLCSSIVFRLKKLVK